LVKLGLRRVKIGVSWSKMNKMGAPHPGILPAVELSGLVGFVGQVIHDRQRIVVCLCKKVVHRDKFLSSACR